MKTFEVLYPGFYGNDWSNCATATAHDHEQAVESWAEESDQKGDYNILKTGCIETVLVREEGSEIIKKFKVWAEQTVNYSATETE